MNCFVPTFGYDCVLDHCIVPFLVMTVDHVLYYILVQTKTQWVAFLNLWASSNRLQSSPVPPGNIIYLQEFRN